MSVLDYITRVSRTAFSIQAGEEVSNDETVFQILSNEGNVVFSIFGNGKLNAPNLPTSAVGLSSGDVWNDGGILKIVT